MEKKKIEIIATAVLSLIFILAMANSLGVIRKKTGAAKAVSAQTAVVGAAQPAPQAERVMAAQENLQWVRCPFSGKAYSGEEVSSDLKLIGIIWDKLDPWAIINGRIVKPGASIGKNKVVEIREDRVILNNGMEDFVLLLGK
ncbi:MAG: hypothetical protein Q8O22_04540 [Candidatus Omnitrophota bacterium]|nr:hypothetical protein [Candidatus Omnitrophota bacterium]